LTNGLKLANDVLLNPTFPADELDRRKQQLTVALRQQRTSAEFLMTNASIVQCMATIPPAT